jgi:hypothetical protein
MNNRQKRGKVSKEAKQGLDFTGNHLPAYYAQYFEILFRRNFMAPILLKCDRVIHQNYSNHNDIFF